MGMDEDRDPTKKSSKRETDSGRRGRTLLRARRDPASKDGTSRLRSLSQGALGRSRRNRSADEEEAAYPTKKPRNKTSKRELDEEKGDRKDRRERETSGRNASRLRSLSRGALD